MVITTARRKYPTEWVEKTTHLCDIPVWFKAHSKERPTAVLRASQRIWPVKYNRKTENPMECIRRAKAALELIERGFGLKASNV